MVSSGGVAEWLGRGLQSPVLRFESGRRLQRFTRMSVTTAPESSLILSKGSSWSMLEDHYCEREKGRESLGSQDLRRLQLR